MDDSTPTASSRQQLEKLYQSAFQPDDYIATYYDQLDKEVEFFLDNLHDFFSDQSRGISLLWKNKN